ncbi:DUF2332 domain-containing protein [Actinospongicola halichondriae]|uniref:DUF2332 domain-containing protein n=1 Tax=Actinospongicola halichondriae TaxID=3236844 RepID=UPI003D507F62
MSEERPRDMSMEDVIALQEQACARAGSHLYAEILAAIGADYAAGGPSARLLSPWTDNALADAIPLRLLAAVHRIVLDGRAPGLARFFPSAGGTDGGSAAAAFLDVLRDHHAEIAGGMHDGVQTNEVGRACSLVGGFHVVAAETGMPLRILEVGASGGLLLRWDQFTYVAGDRRWGGDAGLRFDDPWTDRIPDFVDDLTVRERRGCDINPIDPTTPEGVNTLRGFLWPDQVHRRERLDAAIDIAHLHPATVDRADAGLWVEEQLERPTPGMATVVFHSIVLQYLPRASFDRLRAAFAGAGDRATPDAPLYWLRMEPAGVVADVRLRSWPGGEDRLLGTTGFHGPPVDWTAGES